jgi:iron complex outermembrane recepter protein
MSRFFESAFAGAMAAGLAASPAAAQTAPQILPPVVVKKKAPEGGHHHRKPRRQSQAARPSEQAAPTSMAALDAAAAASTLTVPLASETARGEALRDAQPAASDTALLLAGLPGVGVYTGGGVSNLPVVNGLADDRIGVDLNGMLITSACANHMNAPLSYTDPAKAGTVEVTTGVSPVSKGGDATGGRIVIENAPANFASAPGALLTAATLSSFFRSNGNGLGASAAAEAATQNVSVRYNGSWSRADDYDRGGGDKVLSSQYEAANHALTLTARNGGDLFTFQGGLQLIPGQAYVNQFMDMVDNTAYFFNTRYQGRFDWGTLDARAFYQHTNHEMGFLRDKPGTMPMKTEGQDFGYSVKAELPVSYRDTIRIGNEFHGQTLDDWWPPVSGSMMMSPLTYWNIRGGTRDRAGSFAEWERKWTPEWSTLLGARNDVVWMDTGGAQPYNWADPIPMGMGMGMANPDAGAAAAFNARSHARTDVNFDLTALARFEPSANETFEAGYARKTRSPSLYERYTWGTGMMSSNMIGWFGDLNGYVGNLDLKPEAAHNLSITAAWHAGPDKEWEAKITPYYSYVEDFIDVDRLQTFMSGGAQLRFANHDAQLYGVNLSGKAPLWADPVYGRFAVSGLVGWVEGERIDGGNLYHMMPLNGRFALTHALGGWSSAAELQLVSDKELVDLRRNEPATPGYALLNLRTRYEWRNLRLDLSVENLFDKLYYQPLGGTYRPDFVAPSFDLNPVAGMGRSFNAALTVKF